MSKNKLYVCLSDNGKLSLESREEVDAVIKNAEENDGSLPFTVVGNIALPYITPSFLITYRMKGSTYYEVVEANTKEEAWEKLGKLLARRKNKSFPNDFKVENTRELTSLLNQYYEQ
jgi:hypothetical protein